MKPKLEEMINQSGMTKREVAKAMGLRPETVSRHINHKINVGCDDLEKYTKILKCNFLDFFVDRSIAQIIGRWEFLDKKEQTKYLFLPRGEQNLELTSILTHRTLGAVIGSPQDVKNAFLSNPGTPVSIIDLSDVGDTPFHREDVGKYCYVKLRDNQLIAGNCYPQPNSKFLVENHQSGDLHGIEIEWARPVLSVMYDVDVPQFNKRVYEINKFDDPVVADYEILNIEYTEAQPQNRDNEDFGMTSFEIRGTAPAYRYLDEVDESKDIEICNIYGRYIRFKDVENTGRLFELLDVEAWLTRFVDLFRTVECWSDVVLDSVPNIQDVDDYKGLVIIEQVRVIDSNKKNKSDLVEKVLNYAIDRFSFEVMALESESWNLVKIEDNEVKFIENNDDKKFFKEFYKSKGWVELKVPQTDDLAEEIFAAHRSTNNALLIRLEQ